MNSLLSFVVVANLLLLSCSQKEASVDASILTHDSVISAVETANGETLQAPIAPPATPIYTGNTLPDSVVSFAESLKGITYKYGSTDPAQGFDCSGFITYVFNRFNIKVPRSSVDFTNVGLEVPLPLAKRGDLILFTGTDSSIRIVGHMGIVTQNTDTLKFIHSTSGKQYGVTETPLNTYYMGRFVKIIRIFS